MSSLEKYVEERFPTYIIFGVDRETGFVDVSSTKIDPVCTVSREQAEVVIKERDEIVEFLVGMAIAFNAAAPEAFDRYYYG